MKIIYIAHTSSYYGANRSMVDLILELREKYEIYPIVLCREEGELTEVLRKSGIKFHSYPFFLWVDKENSNKLIERCKILINHLYYYPRICFHLKKEFDLIHTNSSTTDLGWYLAKKLKKNHIWHLREYGKEDYNLHFIKSKKKVNYEFMNADYLVAISNSIYDYYISNICCRGNYIKIYNGIKPIKYLVNRKEKGKEDLVHFCCVGFIHENKNQFEVIRAGKELLRRGYENFHINLIGGTNKQYLMEIQKFVNENNMHKYISFKGIQNNINRILTEMDIGIMPSNREAFGRVTIEYMQARMPVIACRSGANEELVIENANGLLYTLGEVQGLADSMEQLLTNTSKRDILGKSGAQIVKNKFSIERVADEIYMLYSNLIIGNPENKGCEFK